MKRLNELYSGKAKTLFETDDPDFLISLFRDDTSAFNAEKLEQFANKGKVNNHINAFIMQKLEEAGIKTHFHELISDNETIVKRLEMIPVECVVRNIATGSLCKRLGIEPGIDLEPPIFEFFYKDDALGDPMINDSHIMTFQWASEDEIEKMKVLSKNINTILTPLFAEAGLILVDYKLEFGRCKGEILLGDEFTPDGCRLWDADTRESLDKDRFRNDLGGVVEGYEEVARRLGVNYD